MSMQLSVFYTLLLLITDLEPYFGLITRIDALKLKIKYVSFFHVILELFQKIPLHNLTFQVFYLSLDARNLLLYVILFKFEKCLISDELLTSKDHHACSNG
jgi:hypothetical protein